MNYFLKIINCNKSGLVPEDYDLFFGPDLQRMAKVVKKTINAKLFKNYMYQQHLREIKSILKMKEDTKPIEKHEAVQVRIEPTQRVYIDKFEKRLEEDFSLSILTDNTLWYHTTATDEQMPRLDNIVEELMESVNMFHQEYNKKIQDLEKEPSEAPYQLYAKIGKDGTPIGEVNLTHKGEIVDETKGLSKLEVIKSLMDGATGKAKEVAKMNRGIEIEYKGKEIKNPIFKIEGQKLKVANMSEYSDECQRIINDIIPFLEAINPLNNPDNLKEVSNG